MVAEKKCNVIIAGGMGQIAITLFNQAGIIVICGAPSDTHDKLVQSYLDKKPQSVKMPVIVPGMVMMEDAIHIKY